MTSTIKVNNIQNQCGQNIINENSNTITIGASGDTISLASGASQTGFGRTGTVDWQTGSIKTATFTSANGEGYFANTSGGAFTMNLPASPSAGNIVSVKDYAYTFGDNNLTIGRNGSNIGGQGAADITASTNGTALTFIYVDATKGWLVINESTDTSQGANPSYMAGTGGTITTCGNCKIHTFTGSGTFTVTAVGNALGSDKLGYMVVGGGAGGGGGCAGGGGGAGGFREAKGTNVSYTASPLAAPASITVTAPTAFPITVGAGGSASSSGPEACASTRGGDGNASVFSSITSAGGGGGGGGPQSTGNDGGSGGGSFDGSAAAGSGNTPPVSPPQGNDGKQRASGVGGAGGGASSSCSHCFSGAGGDGAGTEIAPASGTPGASAPLKYFAGGGGGGKAGPASVPAPAQAPPAPSGFNGAAGGDGGGGRGDGGSTPGTTAGFACAGATNTGGGGGGGGRQSNVQNYPGKAGGSGIVVIRYKYQGS